MVCEPSLREKKEEKDREALPSLLPPQGGNAARLNTEFPYPLGPTDPCPTAVRMEPFSASAFKVLV